jgi:hypothetical protein
LSAIALSFSNILDSQGGDFAMQRVPQWIGLAGMVLILIFCGAILGGELWLGMLLLIPLFALVALENRHERQNEPTQLR